MKKNKIMALVLGLTMVTSTVTPAFASTLDYNNTSINFEDGDFVINLDYDTVGNIAKDLGLTRYQVESVLTDTYKQTKPAVKPETLPAIVGGNVDYTTLPGTVDINLGYVTLPAEINDYVDFTTLPATLDENVKYTTLPATLDKENRAIVRFTTEGDKEVAVTLPAYEEQIDYIYVQVSDDNKELNYMTIPATLDDYVDFTTLPANAQQPQICVSNPDGQYQEVMTLPIEAQRPDFDTDTEENYQEVTTLPAIDKETRPFINPSKVINAIENNENINLVVVTEEKIETLSEMSGKSEDFVKEILEFSSVKNILSTEKVDFTTLPATYTTTK